MLLPHYYRYAITILLRYGYEYADIDGATLLRDDGCRYAILITS